MRYFIHLSYDGTAYHGWQVQPQAKSVQGTLQDALSLLLRREVAVTGAGRTDTGVHAHHMVAHFDTDTPLDCAHMTYRLNGILPHDIAIQCLQQVPDDLHARFSATARTYHYYVHLSKSPFLRQYSWRLVRQPDFELMNAAARILMEYDDFASFARTGTDTKTTICHVTMAEWVQLDSDRWCFCIRADRFLRNMVRAIVGTLMEVGRGTLSLADFRRVIEHHDRSAAGDSVPAYGLYLQQVEY